MESAIGAEPLSEGLSTAFVRFSAQEFRVALRQEQAAVVGGGRRRKRLETGEERSFSLEKTDLRFAFVQAFAG